MRIDDLTTLTLDHAADILHVRLSRPEVRNAFNGAVVSELARVFTQVNLANDVRVVVLQGDGKSFSAGADLSWMKEQGELPPERNAAEAAAMAGMFLAIARCEKPVVARIHGHALGGGCGLAAASDIAIASSETVFGLTEVKLGIVPAVISPFVMQKIGPGRARALFLTGERFDAKEAERIGLIHKAVEQDQLDAEVARVVGELRTAGPAAVASAKRLIQTLGGRPLEECVPLAARWIAELRATPEAREGMSAFLDKRKASWVSG
jgi:methylglutaconyl-CoA hydratase